MLGWQVPENLRVGKWGARKNGRCSFSGSVTVIILKMFRNGASVSCAVIELTLHSVYSESGICNYECNPPPGAV